MRLTTYAGTWRKLPRLAGGNCAEEKKYGTRYQRGGNGAPNFSAFTKE